MEARPRKKSVKGVKPTPSSSSSSCSIASLPKPVLMEILCRVPIKTLTASKSVCKSWLNLIKDPNFCQMHLQRSPTEVFFQSYDDVRGNTLELHLGNFHFPNSFDPYHFEIPKFSVGPCNAPNYNDVKGRFIFANSCNGLLCYYGDDPDYRFAVVWNPCTSEFITFFRPPLSCYGYGLGFSRKENKFKLLRLMGVSSMSSHEWMVVGDICTIEKSCSWKRVGPCSSHAWFRESSNSVWDLHAVFLQGTLHWVGTDSHKACIAIHTFDFEDDRFGTLPLPSCFTETYKGKLREDRLGVLKDCLFVTEYTNGGATIWLMREYGVQDSWKKLFSLGSTVDKGLQVKYSQCLPITYMDNGEILMKCTYMASTVILYNPVQRSARVVGSGPMSLRVIAYRPSLVPLRDSMLGYDVHVKQECHGLKQGEISTTHWWAPVILVEPRQQDGSNATPLIDAELRNAQVGEEMEGLASAMSESSASDKSPARTAGQSQEDIRDIRGKDKETPVEANKSQLALMLEIEKLKYRNKELEHRDKELEHRSKELEQRDKILEQREKLLYILQGLDNTDQSRMTAGELDRHLNKIKRYENLVTRTFDQ